MANEFVHATVGTSLTQLEFEAVGLHVLNSQATGDLIYASSSSQLSRLGIGSTNKVLTVIGGVPTWQSTLAGLTLTAPVINGTVTTTGLTLPAITLGGTMTVTGQTFAAGAGSAQINTTGGAVGLNIDGSNATHGSYLTLRHQHTTPDVGNVIGAYQFYGYDGAGTPAMARYGYFRAAYVNVTDTTEESKFEWGLQVAGAENLAMTLSGAGGLAVDLDNGGTDYYVSLFDEYDDALMLRQGIQENNRELLADMGVLDRKDTGSGYMMKIQPMVRLLAGGIYQSRQLIDNTREELVARIATLENKLMLLGAG